MKAAACYPDISALPLRFPTSDLFSAKPRIVAAAVECIAATVLLISLAGKLFTRYKKTTRKGGFRLLIKPAFERVQRCCVVAGFLNN